MTATVDRTPQAAARADERVEGLRHAARRRSSPCAGSASNSRRAEFTAIMGPSGSGKSTLMHCLAGLDTVTRGRCPSATPSVTGLNDAGLTRLRRDKVGFIFQQFNLLPTLTAQENILLPLAIAGRKPDPAWFDTVIETVGLARPARPPAQPSSPAASSSGWRAPGPWSPGPRSSSPTSRPATSTPAPAPRSSGSCATRVRELRPDHRDGHPRPERRLLRRPGHLPGRRPDRRRADQPDRRGGAGHDEAPRTPRPRSA